jgi:hypothetical protein
MSIGNSDAQAPLTTSPSLIQAPEDRRSAVALFEQWQRQWPDLFRGAAWLHLERLKRALSDPCEGRERSPEAARHVDRH